MEKISVIFCKSFLDHLRRGLQLHADIAIDFTAALNLVGFKNSNEIEGNDLNDCHIFKSFIRGFCQIIKQYNRQNIWKAYGFNAIFPNNDSNDCYELKSNGFYENYEQIMAEFDSLLNSVKPMNTRKLQLIEQTVYKNIEWIEKLVGCDSNRIGRYSVLIILTSGLKKDSFKNLENIIEKTYLSPISVLIIDLNLNENTKELEDITKIINASGKLDNRNNIEVNIQINISLKLVF